MKKLLMIVLLGSFVFSGVSINKSITYGGLDGTVTVSDAMGVDFDLNDGLSIGYDTGGAGLMIKTDGPMGTGIRLGWNDTASSSTIGVGYNWWTGGENGIGTSIGTALDYNKISGGADATTVSVIIGWGF